MVREFSDRLQVFAALSEAPRLRIVDLLTVGDLAFTEIARRLDLPGNALAHHVKVLDQAGILRRTPSESDGRRTYLGLREEAFQLLEAPPTTVAGRVVFVCTANSARSQIAAAVWKSVSRIPAASAGISPADEIHPLARAVLRRHGYRADDLPAPSALAPQPEPGDLEIAVCDRAHESLEGRTSIHWSIPDPARVGTAEAFEVAFADILSRARIISDRLVAA